MTISIRDLNELLNKVVELKEENKSFNVACVFSKYEDVKTFVFDEKGNVINEALIGEAWVPVIKLESGEFVHPEAILTDETEIRGRTVTEKKMKKIPYKITHDEIDLDDSFSDCFGYADAVLESAEVIEIKQYRVMVKTSVYSELIVTAEDEYEANDLAVEAVRDNIDCDYSVYEDNVELEHVEVCDSDADTCEAIDE